jgi:hypothetical protein
MKKQLFTTRPVEGETKEEFAQRLIDRLRIEAAKKKRESPPST